MITNSKLTIYHKGFNKQTMLETWQRFNYDNVWIFGGKGAIINKGYEDSDNITIRIPYDKNLNIENFSIGDIIVPEKVTLNITSQQDLSSYDVYNITSIINNNFGNNKHIHIKGK